MTRSVAPTASPAPPPLEQALGLGFYATTGPGIGGRLRVRPEDFVVVERSVVPAAAHADGKYTLALVEARDWETHRLVRRIAARLGISERRVFYAGTKDKRAVTVQQMAIQAPEEAVRALDIQDVRVLETRRVDRAPKIGELHGNSFDITLRELDQPPDEALARAAAIAAQLEAAGGFPNFFGLQRFGSARPVTHRIGEAILRGRFAEAVELYIGELGPTGATGPALERGVLEHLAAHPGDHLGALQTLPRPLTTMFVYAHQSLLFNQVLTQREWSGLGWSRPVPGDLVFGADAARAPDPDTLVPVTQANADKVRRAADAGKAFVTGPIYGLDARFAEGEPGRIERGVLAASGFAPADFRVLDAPSWSAYGTRRPLLAPVHDLRISAASDEGGAFVRFGFSLGKGCYATCLLREFVKGPVS